MDNANPYTVRIDRSPDGRTFWAVMANAETGQSLYCGEPRTTEAAAVADVGRWARTFKHAVAEEKALQRWEAMARRKPTPIRRPGRMQ